MMCRQAVESMTDAQEGALSGWRRLSFRFHLAICPYCKAHREQLETTVGVLQSMERGGVTAEARQRAAEAFQNRRKRV